jgi:putative ABC transport system permease protein
MKLSDIIKLSFNNLSHRGLRSWLTIVGIIIGVAAVVSILSIGSGMQQTISSQLRAFGADILTISPGFARAFGIGFGRQEQPTRMQQVGTTNSVLTEKDIQVIKSIPKIQLVNGIISGRVNVTYLTQSARISVQGIDPLAWKEMTNVELEYGRYLMPSDGNAIIIGYRIANEMFKKPLTINTHINIEGKSFKIVGILKKSGDTYGVGGYDNTIFMPISAARTVIEDIGTDEYSSIQVKVADVESVDEIIANIEEKLMLSRHVTENTKDFTITSAKAMQERISEVMGTVNLFLGGIAAISLLVGAIGIANTMFMSVMERTRQIGTLKALGATNFEVMKLFLFESATIGFIGGLLGIFCGFIASGIISELGIRMIGVGMPGARTSITLVTPQLILFALGFSVFIGMISGLLPARKAAGLQPVEALRYE